MNEEKNFSEDHQVLQMLLNIVLITDKRLNDIEREFKNLKEKSNETC